MNMKRWRKKSKSKKRKKKDRRERMTRNHVVILNKDLKEKFRDEPHVKLITIISQNAFTYAL